MALKYFLLMFYNKIYPKFPLKFDYLSELQKALQNCGTILDVGCGSNSPIRNLSSNRYCVGIDIFEPWLNESEVEKIHDKYYKLDVLKLDSKFKEKSFDSVIALDLLEHLTKEQGSELLEKMEKIARMRIIIFTTNGYNPQHESDNNPWNVHKSGWTIKEMKHRGYDVIGINGWKYIKGEYGLLKFRPKFFWFFIAQITQLFVRNRPKKAFQILCVKEKR